MHHINKYQRESRKAKASRKRYNGCERKVAYPTEKAAYQKGQRVYRCPYCGSWHRSGKMAELFAWITGKHAKDDPLRL